MRVVQREEIAETLISLAREEGGRFNVTLSETLEQLQIRPDGLREILIDLEVWLSAHPTSLESIRYRQNATISEVVREVTGLLARSPENKSGSTVTSASYPTLSE